MARMRSMSASSANAHLHVVVIRLLAFALWQINSRTAELPRNDLPLPIGYRSWPGVETEALHDDGRKRLKYSMCATEAATSDDEPFPIGTRFVIETYRATKRSPLSHKRVHVKSSRYPLV